MQVSFSTRIHVDTARALDVYCQRTGKSKASVTDAALREYLKKEETTRISIHGGRILDLLEEGDFLAYEYEVTGPDSVRFYGEYIPVEGEPRKTTTMEVIFEKDNIYNMTQEEILDAAWDEAQVE